MWRYINDVICSSWKFRISCPPKFFKWMTMRVKNSRHFISINLVYFVFYIFNKLNILDDWINGNIFLWFDHIIRINTNNRLNPTFKFQHPLTRKLVPWSCNLYTAIIIKWKLSILKSPTVMFKPLLLIFYWFVSFNFLFY